MTRPGKPRTSRWLGVALALWAAVGQASAGKGAWRLLVDGVEVPNTVLGECNDEPLIDLAALAPATSITVTLPEPLRAEVGLHDGNPWTLEHGGYVMTGDGRTVALPCPARIDGPSVLLPASVLADAFAWRVDIDRDSRLVKIAVAPVAVPAASSGGWESFSVPKSKAELAAAAPQVERAEADRRFRPLLPPSTSPVVLGLSGGYVQGADYRAGLTVDGNVGGIAANLSAFVTYGERGLRYQGAHLRLASPDKSLTLEAGDLFSTLVGLTRGVRLGWRNDAHRSELSLFTQQKGSGRSRLAASLAEERTLTPGWRVGGEVTSAGSYLLRTQVDRGPLHLNLFRRDRTAEDAGEGQGGWASLDLGRGITANAAVTETRDQGGATDWRTLALRVPLGHRLNLTVERSRIHADARRDTVDATSLTIALGHLRLLARYQRLDGMRPSPIGADAWTDVHQQDVLAVVTYSSGSRVTLDYQASLHWRDDAHVQRWDQVTGSWRLGKSTRVEFTTAFPDVLARDWLRLRLVRDLGRDLTVQLEYGGLSPFQGTGVEPGARGLKLQVRRRWTVDAPAGGGEVAGTVSDLAGRGVPNVLVGLGPWRALADGSGSFSFRHVPAGEYLLAADPENLPASYARGSQGSTVHVGANARVREDLILIPYGTIEGRVCLERPGAGNGDGCGEIVAVVRLDDRITATGRDGRFVFANVTPGPHVLSLETKQLGRGYEAVGPVLAKLDAPRVGSAPHVEFRVRERPREIVWQ